MKKRAYIQRRKVDNLLTELHNLLSPAIVAERGQTFTFHSILEYMHSIKDLVYNYDGVDRRKVFSMRRVDIPLREMRDDIRDFKVTPRGWNL
jgi:hypothetical protein